MCYQGKYMKYLRELSKMYLNESYEQNTNFILAIDDITISLEAAQPRVTVHV